MSLIINCHPEPGGAIIQHIKQRESFISVWLLKAPPEIMLTSDFNKRIRSCSAECLRGDEGGDLLNLSQSTYFFKPRSSSKSQKHSIFEENDCFSDFLGFSAEGAKIPLMRFCCKFSGGCCSESEKHIRASLSILISFASHFGIIFSLDNNGSPPLKDLSLHHGRLISKSSQNRANFPRHRFC